MLSDEWEKISNKCFEMQENMILTFEDHSCNIVDTENNPISDECLDSSDGQAERKVKIDYRYYVMRVWIKFEKKA